MKTLALGLMSGTSMDGIDVAIVDMQDQRLVMGQTFAYPKELSEKLKVVMKGHPFDMCFFAELNREVGQAFAKAAKTLVQELNEPIQVIGSHGQTLCHQVHQELPFTWQIGCPYTIYEELKVPVVFDFRSHNVVQGGQGAPLAPLYHQYLWSKSRPVAVVNIGGISNISLLRENLPLVGYDIGPGNCLSDAWIATHFDATYDKEGRWAAKGQISQVLLDKLLSDAFFQKPYPKSIGKEYFSLSWLTKYMEGMVLLHEDVQATLIYLTARLIADEIKRQMPIDARVCICGGGVKNQVFMNHLRMLLNPMVVQSTDEIGISSDFLEAMMMAWLGWCRLQNVRHDVSSVLGGHDQQFLGLICQ
ncbi:MAG: Anhydro-N-acetylmuramic acid kinase [Pseudomonadota bacterium]|nr:Anhydro-N-acetylmuramic acid kinase [Pseudomonadota bacterium]